MPPIVIRQGRMRSAIYLLVMAGLAVWGGLGLSSAGFERGYRMAALLVGAVVALMFAYTLARPQMVLEISDRGLRWPRRTIRWEDVQTLRVLLLPVTFMQRRWIRRLNPVFWLVRRSLRTLGVVPREGVEPGGGAAWLMRGRGAVPVVSQAQIDMPLDEVVTMVARFAPDLPLEYEPGAEPRSQER